MAKPKTAMPKNKTIQSKSVSVNKNDNTGLPVELLAKLAEFGITPRVDFEHVERLDTGSPRLNWIMGGGLPIRRVTTISGKEKTGKTTTAVICCSAALEQNAEGRVFYYDTENKFDIEYAESLGMDMSRFVFLPVETGEQVINSLPSLLAYPDTLGIVIDSIRGTQWDAEANADAEAQQMGVGARMWNKFARKLSKKVKDSNAWLLILNGVYGSMKMGQENVVVEPGGRGIPFMAALRLRTQPLVVLDDEQGVVISIKCLISQVGRNTEREGAYTVRYVGNQAIPDPIPDLSALAKDLKAIPMSGSWYKISEDRKWNGAPAFEQAMREDQELQDYVYDAVMAKLSPDYVPPQRTYDELLDEEEEPEDPGVALNSDHAMFLRQDLEAAGKGEDEVEDIMASMLEEGEL